MRQRRGMTAVVMVVIMMLMSMIVLTIVLGAGRDQDLALRRLETVQAFYAAEAGVNMSTRELMDSTDEDGDGDIGSISDDGDDNNNPSFGLATCLVTKTGAGPYTLTSVGTAGAATREIEATTD